jgi:hypothetical protein
MPPSMRCTVCNSKVKSIDVIISTCRCGNIYCMFHRLDHKCTFDYKKDYELKNKLVKVNGEKVNRI